MSSDFSETTTLTAFHALPLTKKPFLVVMTGKDIAHRYPLLKPEIVIGRAVDADIVLEDGRASRRHARILTPDTGRSTLEDMNSTNGTYVNNQKIDQWTLLDGDLIAIGNTLLKFSHQSEIEGEYLEEMNDSVKTDGLTGLLNRRFFDRQFALELARAERDGTPLSVILCDLDNFKRINDSFGHQVGDLVLKLSSSTLQKTIRETDFAGRYGGEELCVLLPDTDLTAACSIAENIRQAIEQLDINQEQDTHQEQNGLRITVSIGVSSFSPELASIENLLQRADENLYQAKARGKNQVVS